MWEKSVVVMRGAEPPNFQPVPNGGSTRVTTRHVAGAVGRLVADACQGGTQTLTVQGYGRASEDGASRG